MGNSSVHLLAFAATRDLVGAPELDVTIEGSLTVDAFFGVLAARFPALEPHRKSVRLAINGTYASAGDVIHAGDEVALIPPVAGG